jgi:AcrR family transcriptional regulator
MSNAAAARNKTPRGRPRGFAQDEALDAAMRVFWKRGYEGASLSELTDAMGINRSSLYAAFGDKEALFRKALERYVAGPLSFVPKALQKPTARESIEALYKGAVAFLSDDSHPSCCFSVQGLATAQESEPVRLSMIAWRKGCLQAIKERLLRARAAGEFPAEVNVADVARYIGTVWEGLAVQAASGASRADLTRVTEIALRALPF